MIITCNNCQKQYKIDSEKVTEKGAKITCPACGHSFIVKRKAEKAAPKKEEPEKPKTPPCSVCGNPSTRVLQGDPPKILCEHCFETEQEKRRRFSSFDTPAEPSGDSPEPAKTAAPPAPDKTQVGTPKPEQIIPEQQAPEEEQAKEIEYISFDEMPDFPSEEPAEPQTQETEAQEPAPQESSPDPFQPEVDAPPSEPVEDETFRAPEAGGSDSFTPKPEPDPFTEDSFQPGPEPSAFAPEPSETGTSSFEREVEQSILREQARPESQIDAGSALPHGYHAQSHVPAYLISAGILLVAILGLVYYLYSQGYLFNIKPGSSARDYETVEPSVEPEITDPAQAALVKEAQAKKLADQISTARRMFLLDTTTGYQKAIAEMESAIKIDPDLAEADAFIMEAFAFLASLKDNAFYNKRAERLLEKASPEVVLMPEYDRARAHVFINQGQGKTAREIIIRFLEKNPDDSIGFYLLGKTFLLDAPPSEEAAEKSFLKTIELSPDMTRAYWDLANLYRMQGNNEQAREMFRQVLAHSPNKSEAEAAIAEMEGLPETSERTASPAAGTKPVQTGTTRPSGTAATGTASAPPVAGSSDVQEIQSETLKEILDTPSGGAAPPQPVGIEASGDEISRNLLQIISATEESMSRVRTKTAPVPQPRTPTAPTVTYPDRPPEEAP